MLGAKPSGDANSGSSLNDSLESQSTVDTLLSRQDYCLPASKTESSLVLKSQITIFIYDISELLVSQTFTHQHGGLVRIQFRPRRADREGYLVES